MTDTLFGKMVMVFVVLIFAGAIYLAGYVVYALFTLDSEVDQKGLKAVIERLWEGPEKTK